MSWGTNHNSAIGPSSGASQVMWFRPLSQLDAFLALASTGSLSYNFFFSADLVEKSGTLRSVGWTRQRTEFMYTSQHGEESRPGHGSGPRRRKIARTHLPMTSGRDALPSAAPVPFNHNRSLINAEYSGSKRHERSTNRPIPCSTLRQGRRLHPSPLAPPSIGGV
jgi:hypothetical protein